MPLQKNQILTLRIERLSSDGSGVAHSADGEAVFVPGTAPGDEARVRIVKDCGRYAFGILDELLTPSPDRIPVDCPVAGPCGGCSLRHLDYAAELRAKQESVLDAFRRIGGLEVPVLDILPSPDVDRYRNKVQFPVGIDKNGVPCIGFYAGRTHRIVPCPDCKLQPSVLNEIGNALCAFFAQQVIRPYDEQSGKGLVRHIFLRRGAHSGQIMVCLVCTRAKLPHAEQLCTALRGQFPAISTILLNVNAKNTNVILGSENHILYGPGYIEDTLCGVPVRLGPLSFYQVNTLAAERLYGVAAQYAQLTPDDTLLDLYCGMGTIGLSMAGQCRELIGAPTVEQSDAMFNHQIAQLRRRQVLDELAIRFLEHKREQYRTLEQNAGRIWVQNFPEMWRLTFSQEEAADRDKELQQEKAEWLECMPATRWVSRLPRRVMEQFRVGRNEYDYGLMIEADAARRLGLKRTKHVEVVCGGDYLTTIWKKDYRGSFGWDSLDDLHAEIVQRGFRAVGETFSSIAASREQPDGSIVNYHLTRTKIYT